MRITAVETLRPAAMPNVLLLRLRGADGHTGLGEAFFGPAAVEAYLHEQVAPILLTESDPTPERVAKSIAPYVGYQAGGVEVRGNGAVDLALWDLLGKRAGLPVVDLLGGAVRDRVPIYNTCAGPGYVSTSGRQESANWGVGSSDGSGADLEDLRAFLEHPGDLARALRDEGIPGMKVWPFDLGAERTGGVDILPDDLDRGRRVLGEIRDAVGTDLQLMVELHGLWSRRGATRVCHAIAEFSPYWVEDPIRPDAADALARLRDDIDVPIATGETVTGRRGFLPLLQRGAVDIVTVDVQWTGGLTEARKVAVLADTFGVPVAPHDCTGPVTFAACCHLTSSQPNGLVQETVRAFLRTWYAELVTGLPTVANGQISLSRAPGLGVELRDGLADRPDVSVRVTSR